MTITSTERSILFNFTGYKLITLILFPGALCFHVPLDKRPEISETKKTIYAKETLIAGVPLGKEETGNIFCSLEDGVWVRRSLFLGVPPNGMGDGAHGKTNEGI